MGTIYLYNTLTKKKEEFVPLRLGRVSMYSCGPTVYNVAHIGNLRAFITADILARVFRYNDYKIDWAMNTTDVDDKTIRGASALPEYKSDPQRALKKFTQKYEELFWNDLAALNIEKPAHIARATEYIPAMADLIEKIHTAGFAYEKDGSVYFDVAKYAAEKTYGALTDVDITSLLPDARVNTDEYMKENAQDFALWKKVQEDEPSWVLSFGDMRLPGRPGWHIECSAMAHSVLPYPFDIHTGGIDLRFPHHENELAQSTAGYGEIPARFWVHNEHVMVDGKKMAKSEGNFITLQTLADRGFSPLSYRYLLLTADYKRAMNFTWEALAGAQSALKRLYALFSEWPDGGTMCEQCNKKFNSAIADDLNTPEALAVAWKMISRNDISHADKKATLALWDGILGLGLKEYASCIIPDEVKEITERREEYRRHKDWQKSDEMREEIEKLGFIVKDTEKGPYIAPR